MVLQARLKTHQLLTWENREEAWLMPPLGDIHTWHKMGETRRASLWCSGTGGSTVHITHTISLQPHNSPAEVGTATICIALTRQPGLRRLVPCLRSQPRGGKAGIQT